MRSSRPYFFPLTPWLVGFAVMLLPVGAGADSTPDLGHPTLNGVVQMLQADLSSDVITQWLEAAESPSLPSAEAMVALRQAGADDQLLKKILDLAVTPTTASTKSQGAEPQTQAVETISAPSTNAPGHSPASTSGPQDQPSTRTTRSIRTPAAQAEGSPPVAAKSAVTTTFTFSYLPYIPEDTEEWQLYAYLDGKPLAYIPAGGLLGSKPLTFDQKLSPGRHSLRLARERHLTDRTPVQHLSRVAGDLEIPIEVRSDQPMTVEVRFRQTLIRSNNPVSYRVAQGDRVELREDVGGNPDRWSEICEDIELSRKQGKKKSRSVERRLKKCVTWPSLWPHATDVERKDVLKALAQFDYRPVPRPRSLH